MIRNSQDLRDFIVENLRRISRKEMFEIAREKFSYTGTYSSFKVYVCRIKSKTKITKTETKSLKETFLEKIQREKVIKLFDLSVQLQCSGIEILKHINDFKSQGYHILIDNDRLYYGDKILNNGNVEKVQQLETKEIVFGVASDLHFGSKACQITALNEFSEECKKQNAKHIFVPGDVTAGRNVYSGQDFDLYALSAQDQTESLLSNLPEGFDWWLLGGNHDYSHIKNGGFNPLNVMASKRKDLHSLGYDECIVPILDGVDLQMWHPSGGVPYSVSYRLQKGVEQIAFSELLAVTRGIKEKPTIKFVLSGHLHIQVQALFGSIFGAQCGAFEGITNYLKRKGLVPAIGGYIVKATIKNNGILDFDAKFHLYPEIIDDWKNYSHTSNDKIEQIKPIFER
jgi:biotin operon repressor